ncbi:ABC transporter permease subunit [Neobacillus novalis]
MKKGLAKSLYINILKVSIKIILLLISVSSITSLRSLVYLRDSAGFSHSFGFYPINFLKEIFITFIRLFSIYDSKFFYMGKEYDVFPYIIDKYIYTMSILFYAIIITILVSFLISYVFHFFSKRFKRLFEGILLIMDSIPDIIIILASQLLVIRLYQATGFKVLQLYGLRDNVYLLPIICLSFVPIVMVVKIMIKIFEEEIEEQYVEFAIAKGLSRSTVFIKHVVRNVIKSIFSHIGLIYWYMLSSLFVIEYLFQMQGFTSLLYRVNDSSLSSVAIILILIPFGLMRAAFFRIYERRVLNE